MRVDPPIKTIDRIKNSKETIGSILIVLFASLMAATELISNNLEEQMIISHNQQVNYANWYQAKSIKQNLKESELDYLNAMMESGMVSQNKTQAFKDRIAQTRNSVLKYEAEKTEILIGSSNIPREYWAQDLDGEMGKIIGVNQWEKLTRQYDTAAHKYDLGKLLFQICIVLSAVCIVIRNNENIQKNFIGLTLIFGILGIIMSVYGYTIAP